MVTVCSSLPPDVAKLSHISYPWLKRYVPSLVTAARCCQTVPHILPMIIEICSLPRHCRQRLSNCPTYLTHDYKNMFPPSSLSPEVVQLSHISYPWLKRYVPSLVTAARGCPTVPHILSMIIEICSLTRHCRQMLPNCPIYRTHEYRDMFPPSSLPPEVVQLSHTSYPWL